MLRAGGQLMFAGISLALVGCSGDPVRNMLEDPNGYAQHELNESRLPDSVMKALHLQPSTATVRTVRINYTKNVSDRGFAGQYSMYYTYRVRDNGLVQTFVDGRQNGITVLYEFILKDGPLDLLDESVDTSKRAGEGTIMARDVENADPMLAHPKPDSKFTTDVKVAYLGSLFVPFSRQYRCTSRDPIAAIKIHANLSGEAIPYVCETYIEHGPVETRSAYYYLPDYGLHIPELIQNQYGLSKYTVDSVELPEDPRQPVPINQSVHHL